MKSGSTDLPYVVLIPQACFVASDGALQVGCPAPRAASEGHANQATAEGYFGIFREFGSYFSVVLMTEIYVYLALMLEGRLRFVDSGSTRKTVEALQGGYLAQKPSDSNEKREIFNPLEGQGAS